MSPFPVLWSKAKQFQDDEVNSSDGTPIENVKHSERYDSCFSDVPLKYAAIDDDVDDANQNRYFECDTPTSTSPVSWEADGVEYGDVDGLDGEEEDEIADLEVRPQEQKKLYAIRKAQFIYPLSRYDGHLPPLPVTREREAVQDLVQEVVDRDGSPLNASFDGQSFTEIELNQFSIYLPEKTAWHAWEMRGLQNLGTKLGNSWYYFDGILSVGEVRRYVERVPFKICSIGNYGLEYDEVGDNIWIQSDRNSGSTVFYRLRSSSPEYSRYHEGFIWLANLAKYFIDYSAATTETGASISIHNFRQSFKDWVQTSYPSSVVVQQWMSEYRLKDLRPAISANIDFLWKEAVGTSENLRDEPIWEEVLFKTSIPEQPRKQLLTVVTPYVYDCFQHLKFGHLLKSVEPVSFIESQRNSLGQALHLYAGGDGGKKKNTLFVPEDDPKTNLGYNFHAWREEASRHRVNLDLIKVGDVVGVTKDGEGSRWRDEESRWKVEDRCWYVYVQRIHTNSRGHRSFDVIWLYKPSDTTCALMKYPCHNELFFSDNCSCEGRRISEDEILCRAKITWGDSPGDGTSDFFIRQTYLHDNSFVTLRQSHKTCIHLAESPKDQLQESFDNYKVGDTVLATLPRIYQIKHELEPCVIVSYVTAESKVRVALRRLLRRRDFEETRLSKPNELVYSEEIFTASVESIERKCMIRCYTEAEVDSGCVPTPYDRDGTGDAYFISACLVMRDGIHLLQPIHADFLPSSFNQGYDPKRKIQHKALRGLDMYCGGGNLGRGLEEGGAVHFEWAIDIDKNAIHTYFANLKNPKATQFFLGSVDDMLFQALQGNPRNLSNIPMPGEVECISAGSPCRGYSLLNPCRDNESGMKNQSLIASVASYIDFYRPKYALLENVTAMGQRGQGRTEDVLSQLICCLVGMGYQVQLFYLDAWSFGSPQSRSRLFVSIAAPGLTLPPHPSLSHSHPANTITTGLGVMANGQKYGERRWDLCPFEFVTAGEATEDLPDIGDGRTDHCTAYPDHRMSLGISSILKAQIECIPIHPRGMNFDKTRSAGKLTHVERALFPTISRSNKERQCVRPGSKAWTRVHPQKLFPTIATRVHPACGRSGRSLHWTQHRLLTVQEVRRAQSIPDNEVLLGSPVDQWKMAGDTVARTVALVVGLSLREAWLKDQDATSAEAHALVGEVMGAVEGGKLGALLESKQGREAGDSESSESSKARYHDDLKRDGLSSRISWQESSSYSSYTSPYDDLSLNRKRRFNLGTESTLREQVAKKLKSFPGRTKVNSAKSVAHPIRNDRLVKGISKTQKPIWTKLTETSDFCDLTQLDGADDAAEYCETGSTNISKKRPARIAVQVVSLKETIKASIETETSEIEVRTTTQHDIQSLSGLMIPPELQDFYY